MKLPCIQPSPSCQLAGLLAQNTFYCAMFSLSGLIPTLKSLQRDDKLKKRKWINDRGAPRPKASVKNYKSYENHDIVIAMSSSRADLVGANPLQILRVKHLTFT